MLSMMRLYFKQLYGQPNGERNLGILWSTDEGEVGSSGGEAGVI